MDKNQELSSGIENFPASVKFDFVKSSLFRTIHVDGAVGGITPQMGVYMSLFNERQPLPRQTTYVVQGNGQIGDEILELRDSRDAVVREMEVGIVMSLETAEAVLNWLQINVDTVKRVRNSQLGNG